MIDSNLVVTYLSNKYIIGTNVSSVNGNAVIDKSKLPNKIVIPSNLNDHNIDEIGCSAFLNIENIVEIEICNGIRFIREHAFENLPNLVSVRIPESVEFIGRAGFNAWNNSALGSSIGTLIIAFSPNSKLNFLDTRAIGRKYTLIIYFWDKCSLISYNDDPLFKESAKSIKIYAPRCKYFVGFRTKRLNSCASNIKGTNNRVLIMVLLINSS